MRIFTSVRIASFIALLFTGQQIMAQGIVKLSGTISNRESDSVQVTFNENRIAYFPEDYFSRPDKDGHFALEFPVGQKGYVQAEIKHGNHVAEVLLQPGDSLVLRVDAQHFDSSITYAGRGANIQNFVAHHTLAKGRMNAYTTRIKNCIAKEPAEFLKLIEQERQGELKFLEQNKVGLPASLQQYWTAYYQYYNYFFMEQYPQVHEIVRLRRYTDTIPQNNYAVLKELPNAFHDSLLQLPPYLLYLTGVIDIKLKAAGYMQLTPDTTQQWALQDSVNKLANKQMPTGSAEYFAAQNLYGRGRTQPLRRTRKQFADFKKRWPKSAYLEVVERQVAIAERLAPGQPAPDLTFVDSTGKEIKLSELKGKVVYLAFWAAWCRQCVGELMSERKVKDAIRNKPLVFAFVSLNSDTAADNRVSKKYHFDGLHCQAIKGWESEEVKQYGVQMLPSYFLIDEDGNFAMQNPPSPVHYTELTVKIMQQFRY